MMPSRINSLKPTSPLRVGLIIGVVLTLLVSLASVASASTSVRWTVQDLSFPTNLPPGGQGTIAVTIRDVGGVASNGPVTVTDTLPAGVTATAAGDGYLWDCTGTSVVTCTNDPTNNPSVREGGQYDQFDISVDVAAGTVGPLLNRVTVTGGGAAVSTSVELPLSTGATDPGFGVVPGSFSADAYNQDGSPDTQAAGHPFQATTEFAFNSRQGAGTYGGVGPYVDERVKDVVVDLPVGFVGNPQAVSMCSPTDLVKVVAGTGDCPDSSQVGTITLTLVGSGGTVPYDGVPVPVFNLAPRRGDAADFAFVVSGVPVVLSAKTRPAEEGITVTVPDISEAYVIYSQRLTLWGIPGDSSHDSERACPFDLASSCAYPLTSAPRPFLRNPTDCVGPQTTGLHVDSWQHPGIFQNYAYTTARSTSGCASVPFEPSMSIRPDTTVAGAPAGLGVDLSLPQNEDLGGLATADLKRAAVTLPLGMSLNPSVAGGLSGCTDAQIGIGTEAPAGCPSASKIGEVEIATPLLSEELRGSVFLGQPLPGNSYRVFIDAEDSERGISIRLEGVLTPDPVTGQIKAVFDDNPQLPFSDLRLQFKGGARAALVNPPRCGTATSSYELTSWSGRTTTGTSSFSISADGAGAACPASQGFAPSFTAGTTSPQAGAFSPFVLSFSRSEDEQILGGLSVKMPAGLLGALKSVVQCPEPQAAQGACGEASLIGHTTVGAGAGADPFYLGGQVFLTGPYRGAPFGLSIVVPAIAGPFDLGTVVVRAAIAVDPHTAQLTVTTDPLPTILEGVALDLRSVSVTIDRAGFTFNPTDCSGLAVGGTISSVSGTSVGVSTRFQATNCATLAFTPKLTASVAGRSSRANGAALDVKISSGVGQANIGRVTVSLPKALPSRLTTIQKACPQATFAASPSSCPVGSLVGTGSAVTPILAHALTGPAYLVSHGGAAFPDLVVVLKGEGITIDLTGAIDITKAGITSSTFANVPDVPISSFELKLPTGSHSALTANLPAKAKRSFCGQALTMPTSITGQNGAQIKQSTKIAVTGCAAARKKAAKGRRK